MKYYIYKYENDKKEIGYIGLTTNLHRRIMEHTIDKVGNSNFKNIYYFECENKNQMCAYEYFLINKYTPPLNIKGKNLNIEIDLKEPVWKPYTDLNNVDLVEKFFTFKDLENYFLDEQHCHQKPESLPNLIFDNSLNVVHLKIIYCNILKYRLTQSYIKNISEIFKMCGLSAGGKSYQNYREAIKTLQEKNIISDDLKLINFNPLNNLTNEQLFKLISTKQISKYDFLYAELLNNFNFKNFSLSLDDFKKITGYNTITHIKQRVYPTKINALWNIELIYDISTKKNNETQLIYFQLI